MMADSNDIDRDERALRRARRLAASGRAETPVVSREEGVALPRSGANAAMDDLPEQVRLLLRMRAGRLRRFLVRMGIFVILPCLLVLFYTAVIATPRYVCTMEETYQVYAPSTSLAGPPAQSPTQDTDAINYGTVIAQYITSETLALRLDGQLQLRRHYSDSHIDWTSRLQRDATDAQYYAYYGSHVSVSQGFGGYLTVTVQGFDPAFTLKLAQTINADTDEMLNDLTSGARAAEVSQAAAQVASSQKALSAADAALTDFRNTHGDLDPSFIATQLGTVEGTLEAQLAGVRAQLAQAEANMRPDAPQVVQLKLQAASVQAQIDAERQRLAASSGPSYSNTVDQYQDLLASQQLATSLLQAAQQGLVLAQADAAAKQDYVVDFVAPTLPDRPTAPDPVTSTALTFLVCLVGYGVLNLLYTAMRDQTGV